jgi:hypothetical protein
MSRIVIFDKAERYHLHICQYGNIHFVELNENGISEETISRIGLKSIEGCENDNFS